MENLGADLSTIPVFPYSLVALSSTRKIHFAHVHRGIAYHEARNDVCHAENEKSRARKREKFDAPWMFKRPSGIVRSP